MILEYIFHNKKSKYIFINKNTKESMQCNKQYLSILY